jgi:co-chaperonin GroES (HSP10)
VKFRPIGKVVLLRQLERQDISKNGLYMPDLHDNQDVFSEDEWNMKRGEVISIGNEVMQFKIGDKVVVKNNSLVPLTNKKEGELVGIVYESDILVVMEEDANA